MGFLNIPAFIFASLIGFLVLIYLFNPKKVPLEVSSIIPWKELKDELIRAKLFMPDFLFLLQLALLLFLILTLARPYISVPREEAVNGRNYVLIIDKSASMQTRERSGPTSELPDTTRFQLAVKRAIEKIEDMKEDDRMMILASSSRTVTVCTFTKDKEALIRSVKGLKPDDTSTNLREGLDTAFAALRSLELRTHKQSDSPDRLGKIFLITDGIGFSMPSAIPEGYQVKMIQVGEGSDNVAITALEVYQDVFVSPDKREAYVTLKNFSDTPKEVEVLARLTRDAPTGNGKEGGNLGQSASPKRIFQDQIKMLPGEARTLTLKNIVSPSPERLRHTIVDRDRQGKFKPSPQGRLNPSDARKKKRYSARKIAARDLLTVEIKTDDPNDDLLDVDNRAYNYVLRDRLLRILLVTKSGNLSRGFENIVQNSKNLDMVILPPAAMAAPRTRGILGEFDIAIFDRFTPTEPVPINTLYIIPRFNERVGNAMAKRSNSKRDPQLDKELMALPIPKQRVDMPVVLDWDTSHPILKGLDYLDDIVISRAWVIDPPEWATVLARSGYRDNLTGKTGDFPLIFCGSPGKDRKKVVVISFELHSFDFSQSRNLSALIMLLNIIRWLDPQNDDLQGGEGSRYIVRTGEPFDLNIFPIASELLNPAEDSPRDKDIKQKIRKLVVSGPKGQFELASGRGHINTTTESSEMESPLLFTETRYVGEYSVKTYASESENRFIVNFFHPEESDIKVKPYETEERNGSSSQELSHRPTLKGERENTKILDKDELNHREDLTSANGLRKGNKAKLAHKNSKREEITKYVALIALCFLGFEWLFYSLKKM